MNSTHTRFHSECHFPGFRTNHWNDPIIIRDSGSQASPRPTCSAPSLPLARPTSYVGRTMAERCPRRVFSSLKGLAFRASRHLTGNAKTFPVFLIFLESVPPCYCFFFHSKTCHLTTGSNLTVSKPLCGVGSRGLARLLSWSATVRSAACGDSRASSGVGPMYDPPCD